MIIGDKIVGNHVIRFTNNNNERESSFINNFFVGKKAYIKFLLSTSYKFDRKMVYLFS